MQSNLRPVGVYVNPKCEIYTAFTPQEARAQCEASEKYEQWSRASTIRYSFERKLAMKITFLLIAHLIVVLFDLFRAEKVIRTRTKTHIMRLSATLPAPILYSAVHV